MQNVHSFNYLPNVFDERCPMRKNILSVNYQYPITSNCCPFPNPTSRLSDWLTKIVKALLYCFSLPYIQWVSVPSQLQSVLIA